MSSPVIVPVSINELDQLQKISRQTFSETFASGNTEENMRKYLEEGFSSEKLVAEINDPNSLFYFAVDNGDILGYLKLNLGESQTELKKNEAVEIERIYVLKAWQGKNIGKLLFDWAMDIARTKQAAFVWLGVWEENHRAISFYKKTGICGVQQTHLPARG